MKQLADISSFERLQMGANRSMGMTSASSVFNARQAITLTEGDVRYMKALEKEWFEELDKNRAQGMSDEELEKTMAPVFDSLQRKAEAYGLELAYHLTRRYGDDWAKGKNAEKQLFGAVAAVYGNKCTKIFHFICKTAITDALVNGPTSEEDLEIAAEEED